MRDAEVHYSGFYHIGNRVVALIGLPSLIDLLALVGVGLFALAYATDDLTNQLQTARNHYQGRGFTERRITRRLGRPTSWVLYAWVLALLSLVPLGAYYAEGGTPIPALPSFDPTNLLYLNVALMGFSALYLTLILIFRWRPTNETVFEADFHLGLGFRVGAVGSAALTIAQTQLFNGVFLFALFGEIVDSTITATPFLLGLVVSLLFSFVGAAVLVLQLVPRVPRTSRQGVALSILLFTLPTALLVIGIILGLH